MGRTVRRVLVLDVESRLSREAMASLPGGGGATIGRRYLQEIAAVSLLGFEAGEGGLGDFRLESALADEDGERSLLALIESRLAELGGTGLLVTHNGVAHDMPLCLRRCLSRWMFGCSEIARWATAGRERHVDTLLRCGGARGEKSGPALVDLCASLGVPAGLPPASRLRAVDPRIAKGAVDVAATALVWLHLEAMDRSNAVWLARCWSNLSAFLLSPGVRADHLMPIARRGLEVAAAIGV
jgi:hypothetical protein